ncbi:RNA polymerase sigma factor [Nonomuraea sp. NPDC050663]|uniref:RNA polymerase sigma factor n=1 Tax=Nonomuraea sp. NPDC050663 TaxID=3364370 RepID=UPI0037A3FAA9
MSDAALLLKAAADGEDSAWCELTALYGPRMWAAARSCGLGDSDAADAVQGAWLRLLENLEHIREPQALGAWLATTARREALQIIRREPIAVPELHPPFESDPESAFLEADSVRLLWQLVTRLPEPCRTLLVLISSEVGYQQVAVRMGMPLGSIGPTRGRCLRKLRTLISHEEMVQ